MFPTWFNLRHRENILHSTSFYIHFFLSGNQKEKTNKLQFGLIIKIKSLLYKLQQQQQRNKQLNSTQQHQESNRSKSNHKNTNTNVERHKRYESNRIESNTVFLLGIILRWVFPAICMFLFLLFLYSLFFFSNVFFFSSTVWILSCQPLPYSTVFYHAITDLIVFQYHRHVKTPHDHK